MLKNSLIHYPGICLLAVSSSVQFRLTKNVWMALQKSKQNLKYLVK